MRAHALFATLCVLAGCGGSGHAVSDGGMADADTSAGCQPTFGRSFIVSQFTQPPVTDGVDLNGDGKPDNAFGAIGDNGTWSNLISSGNAIFLFDTMGMPPPGGPIADGTALQLAFYLGLYTDPDPSTYFTGNGRFYAPSSQFDVACNSTAQFDAVTVTGGVIEGHKPTLGLGVHGIGILPFTHFIIRAQISDDRQQLSGRLGGVASLCGFSLLPSPLGAGSFLGMIVNQYKVQPDIDVDGDGLEQIVGDGQDIDHCVDGDGTIIPGASCPCDPRIQDGISGAFDFVAVPATIVGLAPQ